MQLAQYIDQIKLGHHLSKEEVKQSLAHILEHNATDREIAAFLDALSIKGETVEELLAFVDELKTRALPFPAKGVVDLCGTGGGSFERFNVSTTAAFLLAAGGVPVAKHGNKGSRRANGSFDMLEALGIPLDLEPNLSMELLEEFQLCFLYARKYHPTVATVTTARKRVARRTIFNLIGPLCNPACISYQLLGTPDRLVAFKMANILRKLGRKRALIVTGESGIDEITISGKTYVIEMNQESVEEYIFRPRDIGIPEASYAEIPCGDAKENARIFLSLLRGELDPPLVNLVCLNAGAVFYLYGVSKTIQSGYELSRQLLRSGRVWEYFHTYKEHLKSHVLNSDQF
ncbi:anthranilate phosphoribosyltransferase [Seinonella peptonophila]|uniref:Anthranilate phosphoribosyltransferase n=1 Tax=Seinonella peptonophila TaxID=112248 RepID=A0A1M4Y4W4_9BACL|nr:anthranilate phosphoribosyltransferase [Seinonella peptonophila]SHF00745.1 anthranilate phosphoribosyltransferase [Seinonella peptonophila]